MKRKSLPVDTAPYRHLPSLFRFSIFLDFRLCRCLSLPMSHVTASIPCHRPNPRRKKTSHLRPGRASPHRLNEYAAHLYCTQQKRYEQAMPGFTSLFVFERSNCDQGPLQLRAGEHHRHRRGPRRIRPSRTGLQFLRHFPRHGQQLPWRENFLSVTNSLGSTNTVLRRRVWIPGEFEHRVFCPESGIPA